MNWYYVDGAGQQAGPLDDAGLDVLVASGTITPETLVWREGMANWQPLREARPGAAPAGGLRVAAAGGGEAVCAECGNMFPVADTIRIGNARVCANCKPVFVQKMREGVSVEAAGTLRYAGFWVRFGASFVDGILLNIVNGAIRIALGLSFVSTGSGAGSGAEFSSMLIVALLAQMVVPVVYETFMIGKYGATLGKMACKIHVVMPDGSKVSYGRAFGRYFSKIVSALVCMIGYIMAGFDSEKRALHDRMCNTRVVYN